MDKGSNPDQTKDPTWIQHGPRHPLHHMREKHTAKEKISMKTRISRQISFAEKKWFSNAHFCGYSIIELLLDIVILLCLQWGMKVSLSTKYGEIE